MCLFQHRRRNQAKWWLNLCKRSLGVHFSPVQRDIRFGNSSCVSTSCIRSEWRDWEWTQMLDMHAMCLFLSLNPVYERLASLVVRLRLKSRRSSSLFVWKNRYRRHRGRERERDSTFECTPFPRIPCVVTVVLIHSFSSEVLPQLDLFLLPSSHYIVDKDTFFYLVYLKLCNR
jgi:hypothetical protein